MASESYHWYSTSGEPRYTLPKADGSGERSTTLRDARKLNLLPSVTTITKLLHSEGLLQWKVREAALAVLSSPRRDGEDLTAFMERVLFEDREQDETAKAARDLGTDIHTAIELALSNKEWDLSLKPFVDAALSEVSKLGSPIKTEKVVVGKGYAGKVDLIVRAADGCHVVVDFKTAKKIPKDSYPEHKLQLAAYAGCMDEWVTNTANIYISTTNPGEVLTVDSGDWRNTYYEGWLPLVKHWQWKNHFIPKQ